MLSVCPTSSRRLWLRDRKPRRLSHELVLHPVTDQSSETALVVTVDATCRLCAQRRELNRSTGNRSAAVDRNTRAAYGRIITAPKRVLRLATQIRTASSLRIALKQRCWAMSTPVGEKRVKSSHWPFLWTPVREDEIEKGSSDLGASEQFQKLSVHELQPVMAWQLKITSGTGEPSPGFTYFN